MTDIPVFTEAEQVVLGTAITFPDYLPKIKTTIVPVDFYHEAHRLVWEAIVSIPEDQYGKDLMGLVSKRLYDNGQFDRVGGSDFLIELMDKSTSGPGVDLYITKIKEFSGRRDLNRKLIALLDRIHKDHEPLQDIAIDLVNSGFNIVDPEFRSDLISAKDVMKLTLDNLSSDRDVPVVHTGFRDLDYLINGMTPGNIYVVAARPGIGKTSFLLDVMNNAAKEGLVYFYSMEMPVEQIGARLISKASAVMSQKIIAGEVDQDEMDKVVSVAGPISERHFFVDSSPRLKPSEIFTKSKIHSAKSGKRPSLIVIDYLQYMEPDEKCDSQERRIASISRALKAISLKLSVPVLVAAQLNRQIENRPKREQLPRLSDIRESGAIEQDATVVMGLSMHPDGEDVVICNVVKNRNGPLGVVNMYWDREATKLVDM